MSNLIEETRINSASSIDEVARLQALRRYQILDTEPDAILDRIACIAALMFKAPISLINLVDEKRTCGLFLIT